MTMINLTAGRLNQIKTTARLFVKGVKGVVMSQTFVQSAPTNLNYICDKKIFYLKYHIVFPLREYFLKRAGVTPETFLNVLTK